MKSRTTNRQGRRLSTKRILEIVTEHCVETPDRGLVKLPSGRLAASTLNRHMRQRGYDTERMTREPTAVRYQAERANMLWHFDMSPSDLKQLKAPTWIDPDRGGAPTLISPAPHPMSSACARTGSAVSSWQLLRWLSA